MNTKYNPKDFEDKIYKAWMDEGCFKAEINKEKEPYTIILPPPNITGQLHMGHALDHTLQDVLIRWKRMQGFEALWLPGTDHASIATEVKVVKKLKDEEGLDKKDIGREAFLKKAYDWKDEYGVRIVNQMQKLGNSCDWDRERFTMDEGCNKSVTEVFCRLYEKGLIYKGNRIVNWCPDCKTTLSDAEVEHEDKPGNFYYVKYPYADNPSEYFVVATTRPETIFGDTAIAANYEDDRYKPLFGKKVIVPLVGREIEIIGDEYPDMKKGTGALKITPSHDPNDFAVGQRHNLEQINVLNEDGTMNSEAGIYEGMDRYECRKAFVKALDEAGYIEKIEENTHQVGTCYRCHTVVEPRVSDQWFVNMEDLAKPALEACAKGDVKFVPDRFVKTYNNWLENIRDWCISRQLWWGHRIPAYYCQDCGEMVVSRDAVHVCPKCGSENIKQDEDVLDTWFSSALWPFSTLGWPEKTPELDYFFPTNVLVTGYDIIFFWVVRMVFSSIEQMGEVPFDHVFIHGLVRDAEGRKMSKSLGNGIDPIEVIDQYGADALRFTLMNGISPGNDTRYQDEKVQASRNFANKLWNASRFVLMNIENDSELMPEDEAMKLLKTEDKWIISRANTVAKGITNNLDKFELGVAAGAIYDFIWNEYCDWYIEIVKPRLYGDAEESKAVAKFTLIKVLKDMLKMLHPFMPFITEEIWSNLPDTNSRLIKSTWPVYREEENFEEAVAKMNFVMEAVTKIRNVRAEMNVIPSKKIKAVFVPSSDDAKRYLEDTSVYFGALAGIENLSIQEDKDGIDKDSASAVVHNCEIFMPLAELIDFDKEIERLEKERKKLQSELDRSHKKLTNERFMAKAPESVVNEEKEKLVKYEDMMKKVVERLESLKK